MATFGYEIFGSLLVFGYIWATISLTLGYAASSDLATLRLGCLMKCFTSTMTRRPDLVKAFYRTECYRLVSRIRMRAYSSDHCIATVYAKSCEKLQARYSNFIWAVSSVDSVL